MSTRAVLRDRLMKRLGDTTNAIWTVTELNSVLDSAITNLYPAVYQFKVADTLAGDGPLQSAPSGARNLYFVGLRREGSNRVREVRNWREGDGEAVVPKMGVAGATLVWGWTTGFAAPVDDTTPLTVPSYGEEILLLRAEISCIERLLNDRVRKDKYININVRQGVTEEDLGLLLDALHASLRDRVSALPPLPTNPQYPAPGARPQ